MDNEFDIGCNERRDPHGVAEALLSSRLNIGRGTSNGSGFATPSEAYPNPEIPLLTYGQEVNSIKLILSLKIDQVSRFMICVMISSC